LRQNYHPSRIFERIGLFDEHLAVNEDYELNYRIRKAGGKILFAPELCSTYYGQQTLQGLFGHYCQYGCWKPRVLWKHPASIQVRQFAAPLFVASIIAGLILVLPLAVWIFMFYLLINLLFSIYTARRLEEACEWRLPLVFATIHLAWGLGFWIGLISLPLHRNPS
jgi:succinoglycan biosynthesis protein ExoA